MIRHQSTARNGAPTTHAPTLPGLDVEPSALDLFTAMIRARQTGDLKAGKALRIAIRRHGWSIVEIAPTGGAR